MQCQGSTYIDGRRRIVATVGLHYRGQLRQRGSETGCCQFLICKDRLMQPPPDERTEDEQTGIGIGMTPDNT